MAQHVFPEDRNRGGVGTDIDQRATRALLDLGQYGIGQCQRSQIHVGHLDIGCLEAFVQVLEEGLTLQDIQEITLQAIGTDAHRIHLQIGVHTILLLGHVENLLVGIVQTPVAIHQFDHHLLGDNGIGRQVLDNGILDAADRLATHANKDLRDARMQLCLHLLDNRREALSRLVNVVNNTLADERRRVFANQ